MSVDWVTKQARGERRLGAKPRQVIRQGLRRELPSARAATAYDCLRCDAVNCRYGASQLFIRARTSKQFEVALRRRKRSAA